MKNCKGHIASALASACIVLGSWLTSVAQGAGIAAVGTPPPRLTGGATIELSVPLFQSRVVQLETGANRVSVGNPDIADIVVISPMELYVLGKDLGETNVLLWDSDNKMIGAISVNVVHDLDGLKRKYSEVLPGQAIEVRASQRSIVLSGTVSDAATMNAAVSIAETFLQQIQTAKKSEEFQQASNSHREDKSVGGIINLLQIGGSQQVMLEVKVAEIARTELKRMNPQFNAMGLTGNWSLGGVNGGASFPDALYGTSNLRIPIFRGGQGAGGGLSGPAIDEFAPAAMTIPNSGLFGSFLSNNMVFNLALDAAKNQGLARILAEPTLTTLTGQEATFLSGGEFPIPVPQNNNTTTIVFKQFGIQVKFLPVVLSGGHINLKMDISVSDLESSNQVVLNAVGTQSTFIIPSLSERGASGVVELGDGQTIGLAGMLNETTRSAVTKFPGLGDLPVLGALFRSQSYIKGETELVILVTPHLAKPLPSGKQRLPTDAYVAPTDSDFYLRGRIEGTPPPK